MGAGRQRTQINPSLQTQQEIEFFSRIKMVSKCSVRNVLHLHTQCVLQQTTHPQKASPSFEDFGFGGEMSFTFASLPSKRTKAYFAYSAREKWAREIYHMSSNNF